MGKINSKKHHSLRPISSFGNLVNSFLFKSNPKLSVSLLRPLRGFTLVELVIVTGILGILAGFILFTLNPFTQFDKAKDAQRQNDIKSIQTAADTFYNDLDCYPSDLSSLDQKYIKKIPNDPTGENYIYIPDPSSCPQWNVLLAKLSQKSETHVSCALEEFPQECLPTNYAQSGHNYCVVSGEVDCAAVRSFVIPYSSPTSTPIPPTPPVSTYTPTPTTPPGSTATPTPTPAGPTNTSTPTPSPVICNNYYAYTSGQNCNDLGTDSGNQCTIHEGSFVCYKNRSGKTCLEPICEQ